MLNLKVAELFSVLRSMPDEAQGLICSVVSSTREDDVWVEELPKAIEAGFTIIDKDENTAAEQLFERLQTLVSLNPEAYPIDTLPPYAALLKAKAGDDPFGIGMGYADIVWTALSLRMTLRKDEIMQSKRMSEDQFMELVASASGELGRLILYLLGGGEANVKLIAMPDGTYSLPESGP